MAGIAGPRVSNEKLVLCCDGPNTGSFDSSDPFLLKFTDTAATYNSDLQITYGASYTGTELFVGVSAQQSIPGESGSSNNLQVQWSPKSSSTNTWTAVEEAHQAQWVDIEYGRQYYGNMMFVAVAYAVVGGTSTEKIMYSNNPKVGTAWTTVDVGASQDKSYQAIGYGGTTYWVAVGADGAVMHSIFPDSIWSVKTATESNNWVDVCWGDTGSANGVWVAVSLNGTNRVMYSTNNGYAWSNDDVTGFTQTGSWYSVVHGIGSNGPIFVAVGGSRVARSIDGKNWTTITLSQDNEPASFESVIYGNGYFVASGGSPNSGTGSIWYSSDAINWTPITTVSPSDGGAGIAVTSYGWTPRGAFGNNKFNIPNTRDAPHQNTPTNRIAYNDVLSLTTWSDITGNNNDIKIENGVTFDGTDNTINFEGTYAYAKILSNSDITFDADFTVEIWVKFDNLSSDRPIWETRSSTTANDGFLIYVNSSGGLYMKTGTSHTIENSSAGIVTDTWYHIVVSRIGGTVTQYRNGVQSGAEATGTVTNYSNDDLYIGKDIAATPTMWLDGKIGLIRVYKEKGLSTAEVQRNFNSHKPRYGY